MRYIQCLQRYKVIFIIQQNTLLLLYILTQSIPFLYCGRIIYNSLINFYKLPLDLIHYQVLFKEFIGPVTSKSRQFSTVRHVKLKDMLYAIVDLVKQHTDSKTVYLINIGQEYGLLILIKPLITARSLHFALNAVNAVIDIFKWQVVQAGCQLNIGCFHA